MGQSSNSSGPAKKARTKKCPVCNEVFVAEPGSRRVVLAERLQRHKSSVHSEYARWFRKWDRRFWIIFLLGALVVFEGFIGTSTRYGGSGRPIIRTGTSSPFFLPALSTLIVAIAVCAIYRWRVKLRFVRLWNESHPLGIASPEYSLVQKEAGSDQARLQIQHETEGLDSTSHSIVEAVGELCNRLGITHFIPHRVRWLPIRPAQNCDFGLFDGDEVDLPLVLRNRVDVQDLKPVIAASLIYKFQYARQRKLGLTFRLVGVLAVLVPIILVTLVFAFAGTFGIVGSVIASVLFFLTFISTFFLPRLFRARLLQSLRLQADEDAARIVGRDALVQTLQKIDSFKLRNIERLKPGGFRSRISDNPSITLRIQRLVQTPQAPEINETILWQGRAALHLRYPLLSLAFFLGLFTVDPGPIKGTAGTVAGATFFLLWIVFLVVTVVSILKDRSIRYCLTNRRIILPKTSFSVENLANVRVEKSLLDRLRGTGKIHFESSSGEVVLKHVKNPDIVQNKILALKPALRNTSTDYVSN
jgi:hypothetical protein